MSKLLLIETATNVCSVLITDEQKILALKESYIDRSHARLLAPFVHKTLQDAHISISDLDAVGVSKGPGSYTGLRIGVSFAKGICYAGNKPLISVPTLESMCYAFTGQNKDRVNKDSYLIPLIDARRMEVYTAIYSSDLKICKEIHALVVEKNTFDFLLDKKECWFFGTGAEKVKQVITHKNAYFFDSFRHTSEGLITPALDHLKNGNFEDVAYFEPFYLKEFITTIPKKKVI